MRDDLKEGTYSPDSADIIRGAKGEGLSRPLAFLTPRDALVYHAIVVRARPDLIKELRPWTGAHQKDQPFVPAIDDRANESADEDQADMSTGEGDPLRLGQVKPEGVVIWSYGNFFEMWLKKQRVVQSILQKSKYVVESDVANYFSSIDLRIVQEYLLRTGLHRDVVRLLVYLVRNVLRHPQYADSPGLGLPQELLDSSRHIAHGLLVEVDREFDDLGERGLYGRFMDDFVAGADSPHEGKKIIARIQARLEPLGLYPNPAKTRIFTVEEYKARIMAGENAYLERVDNALDEVQSGGLRSRSFRDDSLLTEFVERAQAFREIEPRPSRWDRVLRRYYRYMRELSVGTWLTHAVADLAEFPDSASHILEYVRSFPLQVGMADQLLKACSAASELYGDIPLLLLETVATAPTDTSAALAPEIIKRASTLTNEMLNQDIAPRARVDWILAYLAPVLAKFGTADDRLNWVESLDLPSRPVQSAVRLHALPIQVSLGIPSQRAFVSEMAGLSWSSVLTLDFIRALEDGDDRSRGVVIGVVSPSVRLLPNRFQVHSRAISLIRILIQKPERRVSMGLGRAKAHLERNPTRLRDERMIQLLDECLAVAHG